MHRVDRSIHEWFRLTHMLPQLNLCQRREYNGYGYYRTFSFRETEGCREFIEMNFENEFFVGGDLHSNCVADYGV